MAVKQIQIKIRIKHLWLSKAINIPLLLAGLEPRVPRFCVGVEIE